MRRRETQRVTLSRRRDEALRNVGRSIHLQFKVTVAVARSEAVKAIRPTLERAALRCEGGRPVADHRIRIVGARIHHTQFEAAILDEIAGHRAAGLRAAGRGRGDDQGNCGGSGKTTKHGNLWWKLPIRLCKLGTSNPDYAQST